MVLTCMYMSVGLLLIAHSSSVLSAARDLFFYIYAVVGVNFTFKFIQGIYIALYAFNAFRRWFRSIANVGHFDYM